MRLFCAVLAFLGSLSWAYGADVPARLQWSRRVELSPRVSGVVRAVYVEPGQAAKRGQALLALDSTLYRARLDETRAEALRLEQELGDAKRDLDRAQELYKRAVLSTSELDRAKLRHGTAAQRLAAARARVAQDSKNLDDAVLRAPFDAVVVARHAEPGQNVVVDFKPQVLLVLARAREMVARAMLGENQIGGLKPGRAATVVVGDRSFPGKVRAVALEPVASRDGPVYAVDVVFPVMQTLPAGAAATVKLP